MREPKENFQRNRKSHRTDWDELIRVIHHCNEKVEKNNDVDDRKASKHDKSPESSKLLDTIQFKVIEVNQTKGGPKECLCCLP